MCVNTGQGHFCVRYIHCMSVDGRKLENLAPWRPSSDMGGRFALAGLVVGTPHPHPHPPAIAEVPTQAAELTSSLTLNTTLAKTPSPLSWQTDAITLQIKAKRGGKISIKSRLNQG